MHNLEKPSSPWQQFFIETFHMPHPRVAEPPLPRSDRRGDPQLSEEKTGRSSRRRRATAVLMYLIFYYLQTVSAVLATVPADSHLFAHRNRRTPAPGKMQHKTVIGRTDVAKSARPIRLSCIIVSGTSDSCLRSSCHRSRRCRYCPCSRAIPDLPGIH